MNDELVEVHRGSPRFQLLRKEIERLALDGTYRFVANVGSGQHPIVFEITRRELERVFARPMRTPSYLNRGRFHQLPWPRADRFRVT